MILSSLPPEILRLIAYETLPEGFESLALTCKALYTSSIGFIKQHHNLKVEWGHVTFNCNDDRDFSFNDNDCKVDNVQHLLLEVVRTPLVARYIKNLDLWTRSRRLRKSDNIQWQQLCETYDPEKPELVTAGFAHSIRSNVVLQKAGIDIERWIQRILGFHVPDESPGYDPHVTATLLTLCPNVKILQLPMYWKNLCEVDFENAARLNVSDDDQDLWKVLDQIVSTTCVEQQRTESPLAQLETILPCALTGYGNYGFGAFRSLAAFLPMPQLTTLHACGYKLCDDNHTGKPFGQWRYKGCVSRLRHIELANCCMDSTIDLFLAHVPELRTLKYSHQTKWHGCQHDWSAGEFVDAIGRCCGSTIEDLAITVDSVMGEIVTGVVSMKEFTSLKHLEVDVSIFCGPSIASGQRRGYGGTPGNWDPTQIARLIDILPPLLETITIVGNGVWERGGHSVDDSVVMIKRLFADFTVQPSPFFKKLERVHVVQRQVYRRDWLDQTEELEKLYTRAGIDLEYVGEIDEIDAIEAPWRRSFQERFPYIGDD